MGKKLKKHFFSDLLCRPAIEVFKSRDNIVGFDFLKKKVAKLIKHLWLHPSLFDLNVGAAQ